MNALQKRLERVTGELLTCKDPESETAQSLASELSLLQETSKTIKSLEGLTVLFKNEEIAERLKTLTDIVFFEKRLNGENAEALVGQLRVLQTIIKTLDSFEGVELKSGEPDEARRSEKMWDVPGSKLTTKIKLTQKQQEAFGLMQDDVHDRVYAVGGSGSGKSFVEAYDMVVDTLRFKAPSLIARDKFTDLQQGMIEQIIPAVLQLIAAANGVENWKTWTIDGIKFAKWSDKHSKLDFATGGYLRFGGLSIRDLSESGSDKILSPSWLNIMLEEVSELEYDIVEKLSTRLRYNVPEHIRKTYKREKVLNRMLLCENPPSVNHWTYLRCVEFKREDGSTLDKDEIEGQILIWMQPQDNVENVGDRYVKALSRLSGTNFARFSEGKFQDMDSGLVLKDMRWTDNLPASYDWDKLIIYTDPTPLTGKEYSQYADYKASVLVGLFNDITFVIDVRVVRGSTMDMLQNMRQLWDESPNQSITEVWMEKKQVPSDFKQVMAMFTSLTGWSVPIQLDTRNFGDKKAAIETFLSPLFESGTILFNDNFRNTERGRQTIHQILKFSRKANKFVHDDIPDAIMKADTKMKGRKAKRRDNNAALVAFVKPGFIQS